MFDVDLQNANTAIEQAAVVHKYHIGLSIFPQYISYLPNCVILLYVSRKANGTISNMYLDSNIFQPNLPIS